VEKFFRIVFLYTSTTALFGKLSHSDWSSPPLGCHHGLSTGHMTSTCFLDLSPVPNTSIYCITKTCHLCLPTGPVTMRYHHPGLSTGLPPGPFVRACYLYLSPGGWGVTRVCTLGCHLLLSPGCHLVLSPGLVT
jgi:hypothetical protein